MRLIAIFSLIVVSWLSTIVGVEGWTTSSRRHDDVVTRHQRRRRDASTFASPAWSGGSKLSSRQSSCGLHVSGNEDGNMGEPKKRPARKKSAPASSQQPPQAPLPQQQQQHLDDNNNISNKIINSNNNNINHNKAEITHETPTTTTVRNITAAVEKKIRVAKAQAEIDRILKSPTGGGPPIIDMEAELQKVIQIAPPIVQSLAEEELDQSISTLEQDLYQAVKQQDYSQAADIKRQVDQLYIDDCGAVLQVNAAFYRAFSQKDYETMQSLWLKDGTSTCIHPSSKPIVGSKAVLSSWKRMFESAQATFQRNWMEPQNIRLSIKGATMAIVSCDELVFARRFVRGKKRETEQINKLIATNVFRKVSGQWYLCHHHASWHADSEAAKQALRASSSRVVVRQKQQQQQQQQQSQQKGDNKEEQEGVIGMDGILGIDNYGPLLGDETSSGGSSKKPVKRIVMGSLSDIFSGELGDLLGGNNKGGDGDEENVGNAIIQFHNLEDLDDDDDDEDDDDDLMDDDEDDEDDEDDDEDDGTVIIKKWSTSSGDDDSTPNSGSGKGSKAVANSGDAAPPKDSLRQDCISALRKLCKEGAISPRQKRLLLTDIITCSAKGEFSMVEVAFELLCGEGDDKEAAEEEFADQCRVFAQSLSDTTSSQSAANTKKNPPARP